MKQLFAWMLLAGMATLASCGNKTTEDTLLEPEEPEVYEDTTYTNETIEELEEMEMERDTLN
ncbi:hypothetical protein ACFOUP_09955 [Belliella kenyensis]|uniref:Secreted protein n=1 Tax=Belliella kenyensis TaxID=1472724 RepID=A0ABV8EME2_9BACT|nr:hypothetical protein [Belliella kenyensis]MCH7403034.1 hypothetical protein [Belliella kenyensis]MDN3605070.1 hypothetical protein [Belliella kenyensis]